MVVKCVIVDYWNKDMIHRPYRNVPHDEEDLNLQREELLSRAIEEADAIDGDEIEIIVRRTGRRPFGNRRYRLTGPHTYERSPERPK